MKTFKTHLLLIPLLSIAFALFGAKAYAATTYDWIGKVSSAWSNKLNWQVGGLAASAYPGQTRTDDIVRIGVVFGYYHNFSSTVTANPTVTGPVTVASITLGDNLVPNGVYPGIGNTGYEVILTVNTTLTVTGAITQMHSTAGIAGSGLTHEYNALVDASPYTYNVQNYIRGSGTINCASLTLGDDTYPAASNVIGVTKLRLGGSGTNPTFNISGDLTSYCKINGDGTAANNIISESFAELSFASGTINLTGQVRLVESTATYAVTYTQYTPIAWYSMDLSGNADSPTINLFNTSPFYCQTGSSRNNFDFFNQLATGGTGVSTVNYAATSGTQDVAVYLPGGTSNLYNFVKNSPYVYNNVTFSGGGTKQVPAIGAGGQLTIGYFTTSGVNYGGNINIASSGVTLDISTNNPVIGTIGGNYTSVAGSFLTKSNSSALTVTGTTTNGGTFNHSGSGSMIFTGAFSNSGTYNQSGTGSASFTSTFNNSGSSSVFSQTGAATTTFTGAASNDGSITQNNASGNLTFNNTFTNNLSGSTFTLTNGTTTFNNSYSNSGTFTQTGGTVYINQSGSQSLADNSAGGTTFSTVYVQNGGTKTLSGTGQFYISDAGQLYLTGSTTLAANGALTLNSDANGSGTITTIPTGCSVTGNVNVQRYITGGAGYRGYRLISSPVNTGITANGNTIFSMNYIAAGMPTTGAKGVAGGFTKGGNPTLYLFREDKVPDNSTFVTGNYRGLSDLSASPSYSLEVDGSGFNLPEGTGILMFFRGSNATVNPFVTSTAPVAATFTATGTLNQGTIKVADWYNPVPQTLGYTTTSGIAGIEGFNLVGNPYPSSINWDTFSNSNPSAAIYGPGLSPYVYVLNPTGQNASGNYGYYSTATGGVNNATNIIPSGVGFFVQATAGGTNTLTFNEGAKVNTQVTGTHLFMSKQPIVTATRQIIDLKMAMDSINTDETLINFNTNAKAEYGIMEDAQYRAGTGKVSLSSLSGDKVALGINQLPISKGLIIALKVSATATGNYTLSVKALSGIPQLYAIWLKDAFTKDSVNLRTTGIYNFSINKTDSTTFGATRFSIAINEDPQFAYKLLGFTAEQVPGTKHVQLKWETTNEQNYTHFTIERSNDNGKTFEGVGGLLSEGQGDYSLIDKAALAGDNFYRLKQEDFNNTITYTNVVDVVITLQMEDKKAALTCYPNPAATNINLAITPKSHGKNRYGVKISNSSGLLVKYAEITEPNWQANVSGFLTGTYLVQVIDKSDNSVVGQIKFVKL